MRKRFTKRVLKVGGQYYPQDANDYGGDLLIKSITETIGYKMPTKAQYDDGSYVANNDELVRVILSNGMIHYVKKGGYVIRN